MHKESGDQKTLPGRKSAEELFKEQTGADNGDENFSGMITDDDLAPPAKISYEFPEDEGSPLIRAIQEEAERQAELARLEEIGPFKPAGARRTVEASGKTPEEEIRAARIANSLQRMKGEEDEEKPEKK